MARAPKGRYLVELIVANKQFFGQGEYPLQAKSQAAKSATIFVKSLTTQKMEGFGNFFEF
jgi:hypothetical protein